MGQTDGSRYRLMPPPCGGGIISALKPGLLWVWYGVGMGIVMNPHGPVGILWRFSNGCEIKRKRFKHLINVV